MVPFHFGNAAAINPHCQYQPIDINQYGHQDFQNPPNIVTKGGQLQTELKVHYTGPATIGVTRRHH